MESGSRGGVRRRCRGSREVDRFGVYFEVGLVGFVDGLGWDGREGRDLRIMVLRKVLWIEDGDFGVGG